MASYPNTVYSPPTITGSTSRAAGATGPAEVATAHSAEIVAIETDLEGGLPVARGGTGASTAAGARIALGTAPLLGLVYADAYGADPSGATDSTVAINAALAAFPSAKGVVVLDVGTYRIGTSADISTLIRNQGLIGQGSKVTKLMYYGNNQAVKVRDSVWNTGLSVSGPVGGFTIDCSSGGSSADGLVWGDMLQADVSDIAIYNASGIGFNLLNVSGYSEEGHWDECRAFSCADGVVFDSNSWDYGKYDFYISASANQNALILRNGAVIGGSIFFARGNCTTGTTNTGIALTIEPSAAGSAAITGSIVHIAFESDGATGVAHQSIYMDGATSTTGITGTGVLNFISGGTPFQAATITQGNISMAGQIQDPSYGYMLGYDGLVVQGGSQWGSAGTGTAGIGPINCSYGDIHYGVLSSGSNDGSITNTGTRGRKIDVFVQQPASGSAGTVAWDASIVWPLGAPVLSTTYGAVDWVRLVYVPATGKFYGTHMISSPAASTRTITSEATGYTFALTNANSEVEYNSSSAGAYTIPTNTSVAFPVGTVIVVRAIGTGMITVTAATGVTLNGNSAGSAATTARYTPSLSFTQIAANTWVTN